MNKHFDTGATMPADLRRALAAGEIRPYFQPVFCLRDGQLSGFEALARWDHPARGLLGAASFIAVARDEGIIDLVTYCILRESCLAARDWPAHVSLSINLAPGQLNDKYLVSRLLAILAECDFAPERLIVDVTEQAVADNIPLARDVFAALQKAGVRIALDDFEMNYSSLCHLQQLQFDHLKIDNRIVLAMETVDDEKMVRAITGFGRSLGMVVIAEGVETSGGKAALRNCGCEMAQGYLLGRPLTAQETVDMLRAIRHRPMTGPA